MNAVVLLAIGVNADGHCERLVMLVATAKIGAAWNEFLGDLIASALTSLRPTYGRPRWAAETMSANLGRDVAP